MVTVSSIERDYLSGRSVALFTAKKNVENNRWVSKDEALISWSTFQRKPPVRYLLFWCKSFN